MNLAKTPPLSQPLAFVSDIHGNLEALEAVLGELARRAIVDLYAAGDLLLGGDEPLEVWRRLMKIKARCTRGPSDAALVRMDPSTLDPCDTEQEERLSRFRQTKLDIGEVILHQLSQLPDHLRLPLIDGGELLMVHGSPAESTEPMGHDLSDEELEVLLAGEGADIVICGATHVPYDRMVDDVRVVNVGSVGEAPEGRVAHYTVVNPRADGVDVEQTWVEY